MSKTIVLKGKSQGRFSEIKDRVTKDGVAIKTGGVICSLTEIKDADQLPTAVAAIAQKLLGNRWVNVFTLDQNGNERNLPAEGEEITCRYTPYIGDDGVARASFTLGGAQITISDDPTAEDNAILMAYASASEEVAG